MKSVDNQRQRACRFLIGAAFTSVVIFAACSGSTEHKAAPHEAAAGEASGGAAAGAPATQQGGSQSSQAGDASGGQSVSHGGAGTVGEAAGGAGGLAGVGGDPSIGGESSAAGQSTGGEGGAGGVGGVGGAGGAGGDAPFVDPVCGANLIKVGEYSLWCGKVNEHTDENGAWQPDADCSSGCNVTGVGYCQKFYPTATAIVSVPQVGVKDWKNAGFISGQSGACNDSAPDAAGISGQAACCAPAP